MIKANEGSVLIVDDDRSVQQALVTTLSMLGFKTAEAANGERAVELSGIETFDVVLLDANMPGMGGIAACQTLRSAHPHLGIIMLTVRDQAEDKVQALDAGADDYVTKPFQLTELTARLRAAVRRTRLTVSAQAIQDPETIRIGELELNLEARQLFRRGRQIRLTPKEFELLYYLMRHPGILIRHSRLLRMVWGAEYGSELEYLRTFVHQIRKKIEEDAAEPRYLKTEPHVGYRFCDPAPRNE